MMSPSEISQTWRCLEVDTSGNAFCGSVPICARIDIAPATVIVRSRMHHALDSAPPSALGGGSIPFALPDVLRAERRDWRHWYARSSLLLHNLSTAARECSSCGTFACTGRELDRQSGVIGRRMTVPSRPRITDRPRRRVDPSGLRE